MLFKSITQMKGLKKNQGDTNLFSEKIVKCYSEKRIRFLGG